MAPQVVATQAAPWRGFGWVFFKTARDLLVFFSTYPDQQLHTTTPSTMVKLKIADDGITPKEVYNWRVYYFACQACWASVMSESSRRTRKQQTAKKSPRH